MKNKKQTITYMNATGAITKVYKKESSINKILKLVKHICR